MNNSLSGLVERPSDFADAVEISLPNVYDKRVVGQWEWSSELEVFDVDTVFAHRYIQDIHPITIDKWRRMIHPADVETAVAAFYDLLEDRTDFLNGRHRMRGSDGSWIWFYVCGEISKRNFDGVPCRLSGTIYEIGDIINVESEIRRRNQLLASINLSARIMLDAVEESFEEDLLKVIELLGTTSKTDHVFLWKCVRGTDQKTYLSRSCEWSIAEGIRCTLPGIVYAPLDEANADWETILLAGRCISSPAWRMPKKLRTFLLPHEVKSFLISPIRVDASLWGIICFGRCEDRRDWPELEKNAIEAVGLQIAGAVRRQMMEKSLKNAMESIRHFRHNNPPVSPPFPKKMCGTFCRRQQEELADILKKGLSRTHQVTCYLSRTIDQLLDYIDMEAGSIQLETAPFELCQVIEEVVAAEGPKADEKGLHLAAVIDRPFHDYLLGDSLRLRQVLSCMVGYVVNRTQSRLVRIVVESGEEGAERDASIRLLFSVVEVESDSVCRKTPREAEFPFGNGRAFEMELARANRLIELMDGTLSMENGPGRGTTLRFTARFQRNEAMPLF